MAEEPGGPVVLREFAAGVEEKKGRAQSKRMSQTAPRESPLHPRKSCPEVTLCPTASSARFPPADPETERGAEPAVNRPGDRPGGETGAGEKISGLFVFF